MIGSHNKPIGGLGARIMSYILPAYPILTYRSLEQGMKELHKSFSVPLQKIDSSKQAVRYNVSLFKYTFLNRFHSHHILVHIHQFVTLLAFHPLVQFKEEEEKNVIYNGKWHLTGYKYNFSIAVRNRHFGNRNKSDVISENWLIYDYCRYFQIFLFF